MSKNLILAPIAQNLCSCGKPGAYKLIRENLPTEFICNECVRKEQAGGTKVKFIYNESAPLPIKERDIFTTSHGGGIKNFSNFGKENKKIVEVKEDNLVSKRGYEFMFKQSLTGECSDIIIRSHHYKLTAYGKFLFASTELNTPCFVMSKHHEIIYYFQ